jgi:hypothetical protein
MGDSITFRWLDGPLSSDQDWARLDNLLEKRGWAPLNRELSRVRIAEQDGEIVGFSVLQMLPFAGPLFVNKPLRGTGLADKLAADTINYLVECDARGWFVVADSPHAPRLCEQHKMHKVESPVYITMGVGVPAAKEVN